MRSSFDRLSQRFNNDARFAELVTHMRMAIQVHKFTIEELRDAVQCACAMELLYAASAFQVDLHPEIANAYEHLQHHSPAEARRMLIDLLSEPPKGDHAERSRQRLPNCTKEHWCAFHDGHDGVCVPNKRPK